MFIILKETSSITSSYSFLTLYNLQWSVHIYFFFPFFSSRQSCEWALCLNLSLIKHSQSEYNNTPLPPLDSLKNEKAAYPKLLYSKRWNQQHSPSSIKIILYTYPRQNLYFTKTYLFKYNSFIHEHSLTLAPDFYIYLRRKSQTSQHAVVSL